MEKKYILNKYKSTIISAFNLALDSIANVEDLDKASKTRSKERYSEIQKKIENNEELTTAEYSLISIVCLSASDSLANSARSLLRSAENMQNLAKAFIA